MNNKRLIIIGVVVFVFIVGGTLLKAYYSNTPPVDPDAVGNTSTSNVQAPSFNANPLTNIGVTSGQLNNFEATLTQYLSSKGLTPSNISFSSIERQPTNPNATVPETEIDFVINLDGVNTYSAKLDSLSLSTIRLYLYNLNSNTLLYDSQNVGGSS
jgi:Flp pilus assembly protein CpaB